MRFTLFTAVLALLLMASPRFTWAEEEGQAVTLEPVEVVGEKVDLFSGAVPRERINELQPVDIGDLLKKDVDGMSAIRRSGIALDPVLRGMSKDRLNVLVDGDFVHGACANRMDPPTMHVSPYQVEGVVVTKGPFDVTLGPGALGGVINVKTIKPRYYEEAEFHPELRAGFDGVSDGRKGGVTLRGGLAPFAYDLSYDYKDSDGYRDGSGKRISAGFKQSNFGAGLDYFIDKDSTIGIDYSGQRSRDVFYPTLAMDSPRDDMDTAAVNLELKSLPGTVKSVDTRVYSSWVTHDMNNFSKFSYTNPTPLMMMEAPSKSRTYGGKMKASLDVLDGTDIGVDYYNRWWDITLKRTTPAGTPLPEIRAIPDTTIADAGLFVQPSKKFGGATVTAGARVDFVRAEARAVGPAEQGYFDAYYGPGTADKLNVTETNTGGFLKGKYDLTDAVNVYAGVGRGVRTADSRERFRVLLPMHGGRWDIGNPNLAPEESLQYEIGSAMRHGKFSYNLSLFENNVRNFITQFNTGGTFLNQPVMGYKNVDARLYGGEVSAGVQAVESVSLLASASYTYGRNKDENKPLPEIMPLEGRAGLRYDAASGHLWAEVMGRFAAAQRRHDPVVDPGQTAGFSTADVRVGWKLKNSILLTTGVENLFDRYYYEHTSKTFAFNQDGYTSTDRIPEPGRNIYVNLTMNY